MEKIQINKLKKKIVICKDAGAAQIILSYIIKNKVNFDAILSNPAKSLFKKKFKKYTNIPLKSFLNNISSYDEALIGTGRNNFEIEILNQIKKKIKTKGFIDHWCFYKDRFKLGKNKFIYPDKIIAHDEYSFKKLKKTFPKNNVILSKNLYWKEQIKKYKNKYLEGTNNVLILCSSLTEDHFKLSLISNFLKKLRSKNYKGTVILRPHPMDIRKNFKKKFPLLKYINYEISKNNEIGKDISRSNFVIGFKTSSLVLSLKFNKKTFSFHTRRLLKISIPHKRIDNVKKFYNFI